MKKKLSKNNNDSFLPSTRLFVKCQTIKGLKIYTCTSFQSIGSFIKIIYISFLRTDATEYKRFNYKAVKEIEVKKHQIIRV